MRKLSLPVFAVLLLICNIAFTQPTIPAVCAFDSYLSSLNFPATASYQQLYEQALDKMGQAQNRDFEIYHIPVVVHVVYTNEEENISQQRVEAQIKQLNKDFRRNNEDAETVRPVFEQVVGDPGIEFQLVQTNRIKTDTTFGLYFDISTLSYRLPDHVKSNALGGSSPWDSREYLNIWVCPIEGDLIYGYAYPPADIDNWPEGTAAPHINLDGIVINYKAFGGPPPIFTINENERVELNGRTLTHEVGHYLGLRHPWGDSELGVYQCFLDDGLQDTPTMKDPTFGACDHDKNTCGDVANDLPDMIENFMDFSAHECQNSFTLQQIDLMRYVLHQHRRALRLKSLQVAQQKNALVYPNPSNGFVKVMLEKNAAINYQLRISNAVNHSIQAPIAYHEDTHKNYRIDLSGLPPGIYFIELIAAEQRFTERVVLVGQH